MTTGLVGSGARLALARHLRNGEKAAVARRWDCCHFSAPHRGGPERAAPNILNNEKVFTVFLSRSGLQIHLSSSHPVRLIGGGGWVGWPTCTSRWHNRIAG